MLQFTTKSSLISLIANGKITHVLNPWVIFVDIEEGAITVRKKNWFLIGTDEQYIAFRFIRNITRDEHLFGADLFIKAIGGNVKAFCLPKKDAKQIRDILNKYNKTRGKKLVFA